FVDSLSPAPGGLLVDRGPAGDRGGRQSILQRLYRHFFLAQGRHGKQRRVGRGNGGDAGHSVRNGRRANPAFVGAGAFAAGRVDNQPHLPVDQVVDQVG